MSGEYGNGIEENCQPNNGVMDFVNNQVPNMEHEQMDDAEDGRVGEDAGKDEFVDAPDELNAESRDPAVTANHKDVGNGRSNGQDSMSSQLESTEKDLELIDELRHLQTLLDKTVEEKEMAIREYKEERDTYMRQLGDLHHQLKALRHLQVNGVSLVEDVHKPEYGGEEGDNTVSNSLLLDLISDCSMLVKNALEERSQMEGTIKELHSILYNKDEQIVGLNEKISELSVSHDLALGIQNEKNQHIEDAIGRMLSSVASVIGQDDLLDNSVDMKIDHLERMTSLIIEKHNRLHFQINQLRQCLSDSSLESMDFSMQDGLENVVIAACNELVKFKRKEVDLAEKLSHVEVEKVELVEQLRGTKTLIEEIRAERDSVKLELEQEKMRCANLKEKLSLAVTKGKSLVQHRDSLKQSLADKTSELEKCMKELKEKTLALEAAEQAKDELAQGKNLVTLLQENLSQRNAILMKFEEVFSPNSLPEEVQDYDLLERCKWLVDERNALQNVSMELKKLKEALSMIELPDSVLFVDLESKINWLREYFYQEQQDIQELEDKCGTQELELNKLKDALSMIKLPDSVSCVDFESHILWLRDHFHHVKYKTEELEDKIIRTKEAANLQIDRLSASLSTSLQEKEYLQMELDCLMLNYNEIAKREQHISLEREQLISSLLEHSGINTIDRGMEVDIQALLSSDTALIIDRFLEKMKEQNDIPNNSFVDLDLFETIQSLLYVRDLEFMLYERVVEDEMLNKTQETKHISNELNMLAEKLSALKEEKEALHKDLEKSEEKSALLREKLSMAVKKGKGLVQDRENLKNLVEEKNSEIEKLMTELELQQLALTERGDQINVMSTQLEGTAKLEADLAAMKDQRDQFEKFLQESNNLLERLIESIDNILIPTDSVFNEPVEKVGWLAGYLVECQNAKEHADQELLKVREEADSLASRLEEAHSRIGTFESANLDVEKLKDDYNCQASKLEETQVTIRSLEDALAAAQSNISQLTEGKNEVEVSKANVEKELEEATKKAQVTIRSLEDALLESQTKISQLSEEKNELEFSKANVVKELQEATKEAQETIRSLEDSLLMSQTKISQLSEEKNELEFSKANVEKELQEATKEAQETIRSLEDSLVMSQTKISQLSEEKNELEFSKANIEKELQEAIKEATSHSSNFSEASAIRKALEDALSLAENNIAVLTRKKEAAEFGRGSFQADLEKTKEEVTLQTRKLSEAYETIKSLEDSISGLENNISLLTEQNNDLQSGKANLETELTELKDEATSRAKKLDDALVTVKSLEDALSKAEDHVSLLENEKKVSNQEISTLNLKLNACLEELAGTTGSLEKRNLELVGNLDELLMLMRDDSLSAVMSNSFQKIFDSLKDMDMVLEGLNELYGVIRAELPESKAFIEDNIPVSNCLLDDHGNNLNVEVPGMENEEHNNNISQLLRTIAGHFQLTNNIQVDKFKQFASAMDGVLAALLKKFKQSRDRILCMLEQMKSLKQEIQTSESHRLEQENAISLLHDGIEDLFSACVDATKKLHYTVESKYLMLDGVPEHEALGKPLSREGDADGSDAEVHEKKLDSNKYVEAADNLLFAVKKAQGLIKLFEMNNEVMASKIQNMESELREAKEISEGAIKERTFQQTRVSKLEGDVEILQSSCGELGVQVKECQATYDNLKDRESELSSKYNSLLRQREDSFLSPTHVKTLFDKIGGIEVSYEELSGYMDSQDSLDVKKIFYVVDSFTKVINQVNSLSHDKEELQSSLATKDIENEQLKEEIGMYTTLNPESENMKSQLSEINFALEKLCHILGGSESVELKSSGVKGLLGTLEKETINLLSEFGDCKLKVQELEAKLVGSQKIIDELSSQVKFLEDSSQSRILKPEIIQERSIFEAPSEPSGSEIAEVEDKGTVGKPLISPASSAAHVRNMRKGSTDHLVLNIDDEANHLINHEEANEDKGHVFKSLNASGLIPKQGKFIADKIDGIWVSGGRVLTSRPEARLGVIAYWLFLHIWLLVSLL